jgi:DNA-binding Xre family transcriptional regulator
MAIAEQLREAIRGSNETFYVIAKDAGVNWSALQRFVTGERPNIRIDTVEKLCEYFGLELAKKKPGTAPKEAGKVPGTAPKQAAKKPAAKRKQAKKSAE